MGILLIKIVLGGVCWHP